IGASSIRTITVGCTPTAAQVFTGQLEITAPNALTGSPISVLVKCTGTSGSLYATPSTIQLGEVRTGSPRVTQIVALKTAGGPLTITSPPALSPSVADVSVTAPSSNMITLAAPSTFDLNVDATADHDIATSIAVTASGDSLAIPVTGKVVTAKIAYPESINLGSFCVNQSTTGAGARLSATGTATIGLATQPVMNKMSSSPFQLSYTSPVSYPYSLPPNQSAMVEVTPLRQMAKGVQTDDVVWTTDVSGEAAPRTTVTAAFIADGGAIAPQLADFGPVMVKTIGDPKVIKIQNCGMEPMSLSGPDISPGGEFSDDSAIQLPDTLAPNAIATINVKFKPTKVGTRMATLTVSSSKGPLVVNLLGVGIAAPGTTPDSTSFYACDCTTSHPTDAWPAVLVVLVLRRRRRR
ncbi:MAG: choice-of-anchor D domain-containing protein, partial [Polyangiales bacterium]